MKRLYLLGMGLVFATMSTATLACVHPNDIYYWADMRDAEHFKFDEALNCDDLAPETLEITLISLGRIGGDVAVKKIMPYLEHDQPNIREAAAFALGIAKVTEVGDDLIAALKSEQDPEVQYRLALALGNTGNKKAQDVLIAMINQGSSPQMIRGALQGLVLLSSFHKEAFDDEPSAIGQLDIKRVLGYLAEKETQLEASYLLARIPLLTDDEEKLNAVIEMLFDSPQAVEANLIKALAEVESMRVLPMIMMYLKSRNDGARINAIWGLSGLIEPKISPVGANQVLVFGDEYSQITALQVIQEEWLNDPFLREDVINLLRENSFKEDSSWVQSEALITLAKSDELRSNEKVTSAAKKWLDSDNPNLQRAAIEYYVEQNDTENLKHLSKSDKKIIANGAKQALNPEPESAEEASKTGDALPELPAIVDLETTKGIITIKLFADTPYTSANFIELVENGFYNDTYFHRVIPNFVAQGGSKVGDGTGNVDYSIREELSYRSHLPGTVGMATIGKDTGGAQFFINTAPNLHLDSNYTIFGQVIEGMDVAMQLEQNDQVISAKTLTSK